MPLEEIPRGESEVVNGNDELGWPIRNDKGEIVLSRVELLKTMGRLYLVAIFLGGLFVSSRGWNIAHGPAWPSHFVLATVFWLIFTVPVGWVAWAFGRVIRILAADDDATERLRVLRKLQEVDERERREEYKALMAERTERRRRGEQLAREIAERRRMVEGQRQIELELGD